MRNVRIRLAYDGSAFYGWQRQEGFESVQEALEEALESLLGEKLTVFGSGRTDTGVHALGQVANFHLDTHLSDNRLLYALNAHLPESVVISDLETCPDSFHAQKSAVGKRYLYYVRTTRFRPAFGQKHAHWMPDPLDLSALREAARHMQGEHDFSALANAGSPRRSNVRKVSGIRILARRDALCFLVSGTGFLYNMVRTIAGTLLEVGRGRIEASEIPELLASKKRAQAGPTAPAAGLYLLRVFYADPCFQSPIFGPRGGPGVFFGTGGNGQVGSVETP